MGLEKLFLIMDFIAFILMIILFFKIWRMTNDIKIFTNVYMHAEEIKVDGMAKSIEQKYKDKDGNNIKIM
tara:strand:- start:153 stop:362 length:210 start_codon:yes stop_codon:yes gene_type:complete